MKKIMIVITILLGVVTFSGCTTHTFRYDYDELMEDLTRAEIIYMAEEVFFFEIHWYVGIDDSEYEVVRELTVDETHDLIRALSSVRFSYNQIWLPASISSIYSMQGYGIKLYYGENQFIIIAQTGDYGHGMRKLAQVRAGRTVTDRDWDNLFSEFDLD